MPDAISEMTTDTCVTYCELCVQLWLQTLFFHPSIPPAKCSNSYRTVILQNFLKTNYALLEEIVQWNQISVTVKVVLNDSDRNISCLWMKRLIIVLLYCRHTISSTRTGVRNTSLTSGMSSIGTQSTRTSRRRRKARFQSRAVRSSKPWRVFAECISCICASPCSTFRLLHYTLLLAYCWPHVAQLHNTPLTL